VCQRILEEIERLGVRQTSLLVIPNHHGKAPITENTLFQRWLTQKVDAGHEPVLHGYFHQRERRQTDAWLSKLTTEIYTAGEGEFFDLSREEAEHRICRGVADLSFLQRKISGFIAPAWLLGREAEQALKKLQFGYTTRVGKLLILGTGDEIKSRSLVWSTRAQWRSVVSLMWNAALTVALAKAPVIRIAIHPLDCQQRVVWRQICGFIAKMSRDRCCISYERLMAGDRA
jgi:predicted deacetylase